MAKVIAAFVLQAATGLAATAPLIGAHYFGGWYTCTNRTNCWSHFKGYQPRGEPTDDFFPFYPERTPLLGNLSTSLQTVMNEVQAADKALDFFSMLYYDGDADCGIAPGADPNLRYCLDASLAFMLNTSAVWDGTSRLHFFITYSNDVDRSQATFVGPAGQAAWQSRVRTWVAAMAHPRYLKINGRPVFQVLIPDIFSGQCGGNATLANALLDQFRAAGVGAGVGEPLVGGGWQSPSIPSSDPAPRPHPDGYMRYPTTDIPCPPGGGQPCDLARLPGVALAGCEAACNGTAGCTAFVLDSAACQLKALAGPGAPGPGDAYVRVLDALAWEWTGTYNDAPPVCPDQPNWECQRYKNSWWPNATADGAKVFTYLEMAQYQAGARGNHSLDPTPYLPNVIAGFDPRPWEEQGPSFAAPTRAEWTWALQQLHDFVAAPGNARFGFPDASAESGVQPAGCIYAWNEFGEGGIAAPTAGAGTMMIDVLAEVFGRR